MSDNNIPDEVLAAMNEALPAEVPAVMDEALPAEVPAAMNEALPADVLAALNFGARIVHRRHGADAPEMPPPDDEHGNDVEANDGE